MKLHQTTLLGLLELQKLHTVTADQGAIQSVMLEKISTLDIEELSSLYIDTAFTNSGLQFLQEQYWLVFKNRSISNLEIKCFLSPFFKSELPRLAYLEGLVSEYDLTKIKGLLYWISQVEKELFRYVLSLRLNEQKTFAKNAFLEMNNLYKQEIDLHAHNSSQGHYLGLSLYRTFDGLDNIFALNYSADENMNPENPNTERLYEGSGIGVQSSYSTLLTALRYLNPLQGSRIIDLGSGYGRLGLVIGLMRPDIDFVGYEYVEHRVEIANSACNKLDLQDHVQFFTQDLSLKEFEIPIADIYYLYDPFTKETYDHVLSQLVQYSKNNFIRIVTKGNARDWLQEIANKEGWPPVQEYDSGNLCLFHTR